MITGTDRTTLRELARWVAEIAALPIQAERRALWKQHNSLKTTRPLILVFPEGAWEEILTDKDLVCEGDTARRIEWQLRSRIYYHEHFQDDTVIEKTWVVNKGIHNSGWGLEAQHIPSPEARGAWHFDPVIHTPADMQKLRFPDIAYDEATTQRVFTEAQDLFGDILDVQLKGVAHISYHLMAEYTGWRGLEEVMTDMALDPSWVHDAMAFLTEGHRRVLQQYIDQNLLSLNNDATYQNSGGNGYTDELPAPDFDPARVRPCDMWASAEAQEMAGVSPKMHAEFILQYEKQLLAPFGLTGYGCCEDLTRKLDDVFTIPHIRRISISPFADVDKCAPQLKGNYIFSWKPNPAHLVGHFDEDRIRAYIRHAIAVAQAHGCVMEMILKDTHTCEHHPERFERWLAIAREVRAELGYE
ncbi:MAG: hypothetical protein JXR84_21080 [Anaerolineae bacterium]|nr:hypothetical protein [Anaerolineae bacterium]